MPYNSKIAVKIGRLSTLRIHGVQAYRAITIGELEKITQLNSDINIIIIEEIYDNEYSAACEFIREFRKESNHAVIFYVPDNNDTTTGVADELSLDIFLNLPDLYKNLKLNYNINVSPDLSIRVVEDNSDAFDTSFDTSFSEAIEVTNKAVENDVEENKIVNKPIIMGKDDIDNEDISSNELGLPDTEKNEEEKPKKTVNLAVGLGVDLGDPVILAAKITELSSENRHIKTQILDTLTKLKETKIELANALAERDKPSENSNNSKATDEEYEEAVAEKTRLGETVEQQNLKIGELETELAEQKETIEEQEKRETENRENTEKLNAKIVELEETVEQLKLELDTALTKLNTFESDNSLSEEIDRLTKELETALENIRSNESKLSDNELEIDRLTKESNKAQYSLNLLIKLLSSIAVEKVDNDSLIVELRESVDTKTTKIDELENTLKEKQESLDAAEEEANRRVDLAKNYIQTELDNALREVAATQSKNELLQAQYTAKEIQYNSIIQSTGMDEGGASTIMEHNKTLEVMNKTLMGQLSEYKKEIEKAEEDKINSIKLVERMKDQNHQLTISVRAMSTGITGGAGLSVIPKIGYSGTGFIIPVIGSGSFGVTTTAMSMAMQLSVQSKVIYIDFDMVSAKSDSWFKTNPMIKNIPGIESMGAKASGLGLFIDKGAQFFYDYATSIINRPVKTKGGYVDYLSGIYSKPDTVKLVAADYAGLIGYCGSNYDYVIIDFGRLGCSDINDQIIQTISEVAHTTVVVTPNDKMDIRNMRFSINKAKLDIGNMAWLINLSENTKLDDLARNSISPAKSAILPFVQDFYGQKRDFTKEKPTRDKFSVFLTESVLRK